ncbi:MAG: hypothetical protein ABS95_02725 [Verrucomicrobia bacterium SCN 57-15]|nr:MAG: hypothetical protein ABS95_02725 [Verrucomicrobia bacterium SCN 57-15]
MKKLNLTLGLATTLAILNWMNIARAGNDIYFVTYNHYIDKGELELMLMNDFTDPSKFRREDDGQRSYFSQMIELEYGVTEQWATEFMIEGFEEPGTGQSRFTGFRWENRYRLFKQDVPLNPMLYVEYEDLDPATRYKMEVSGWVRPPYKDTGDDPDRERILESRLVLSQDFGKLNVAFNWINESDLNASGFTAFGYALGARYDFNGGHFTNREPDEHAGHHGHHEKHALLKPTIGVELYGGVGDTRRLDFDPSRQEHYLQPDIMLHLNEHMMLHLGFAIGLSKASDNLVRTALAIEF